MNERPTVDDEEWVRDYLTNVAEATAFTVKGSAPVFAARRRKRRLVSASTMLATTSLVAGGVAIAVWPTDRSSVLRPDASSELTRVELPVVAETRFMSQALLDGGTLEIDSTGCATYRTPDRTIGLAWGPGWAAVRHAGDQWSVEGPNDVTIADGSRVTLIGGYEGDKGCNGESAWAVGTVEPP